MRTLRIYFFFLFGFLINKFLIEGWLLYNVVLVSAIHQHESAIGIHMSSPSWTSLPPPTPSHPSRLSQSTGLSSLSHTANSHWQSILHMVMYMFPCYSLHSSHPLPFLHPASISLLLCLPLHCYPANRFFFYNIFFAVQLFFFNMWEE